MSDAAEQRGLVLEIQRMSTEDGPGIRTTVFMKGCTLDCDWCHNPESIAKQPQIIWHDQRCMGCRLCLAACPQQARDLTPDGLHIDRERCQVCGECVAECPTTAAELMGKSYTVEELVAELSKDRAFFDSSGGGITISGGEPTMQASFVTRLLERCRGSGLHTALDTCGTCSAGRLLGVAEHADLVLYDLKLLDPERHRAHTGRANARILENLGALRDQMRASGRPSKLWIRTPLIPGATAFDANIEAIGAFIATSLRDVLDRWELCAFNNLCGHKYQRLGKPCPHDGEPLLSTAELAHFERVAKGSGVDPDRVLATGSTRFDEPAAKEQSP